jgi:hypothetical protein
MEPEDGLRSLNVVRVNIKEIIRDTVKLKSHTHTHTHTHTHKVKVKMSLCLTKHHAMKTYWGNGGIAPRIFDLGTRRR